MYDETWAGRQPATRPGKHNFPVTLSPFADDGSLLPFIREPELDARGWPSDRIGEGDGGLQAYGFRVCMTNRGDNGIPFSEPQGYDPGQFELLRRLLASVEYEASDLMGLVPDVLPNGKCDVNSIGPFSLNLLDGSNRDYPDGDAETRERVRTHHLHYTQSLLWFLSTDEDVPPRIRDELQRWGLCADEFTHTDGWPHQLYVRDGRRMLGDYVLRESRSARRAIAARRRGVWARTTSTSARSSGRGVTCPSTTARPRSSTRDTFRSRCRPIRSRTAP